jgi:N6-adenosine-specific RNA methylase IME4
MISFGSDHVFAGLKFKHYRVIYADPAWKFSCGTGKGSRHPDKHYRTMPLAEIKALPVRDLAHPDGARLLCWATIPMLPHAIETIEHWGFRYSTARVWAKTWPKAKQPWTDDSFAFGPGYEVLGNPELLIIAKTGKPQPIVTPKPRALIIDPRRQHSRKPDKVRDEIVARFDGPYVELFARESLPSWDVWGNEVNRFNKPMLVAA